MKKMFLGILGMLGTSVSTEAIQVRDSIAQANMDAVLRDHPTYSSRTRSGGGRAHKRWKKRRASGLR